VAIYILIPVNSIYYYSTINYHLILPEREFVNFKVKTTNYIGWSFFYSVKADLRYCFLIKQF